MQIIIIVIIILNWNGLWCISQANIFLACDWKNLPFSWIPYCIWDNGRWLLGRLYYPDFFENWESQHYLHIDRGLISRSWFSFLYQFRHVLCYERLLFRAFHSILSSQGSKERHHRCQSRNLSIFFYFISC